MVLGYRKNHTHPEIVLGGCPRIDILFKIKEFSKNKRSHIVDIASIIFLQF